MAEGNDPELATSATVPVSATAAAEETSATKSPVAAAPAAVRWGILGTGNIAGKFAAAIVAIAPRARLQAVGSRAAAKAQAFAQAHGIPRAYGSYESVLADPEVDAVYISLPNHLHARWSIDAARSGKHILCEKPAAMTARELEGVLKEVRMLNVFYMEAYAYRCHPRYRALRKVLESGAIGAIRMLHATFAFDGSALERPRIFAPELGGGGLMDVGVYPLSWLRWIAGAEPIAAKALGLKGGSGVDEWAGGVLRFPAGAIATFATAVRCAQPSVAAIYGAKASIEVIEPWRCPANAPIIVRPHGGKAEEIVVDDGLSLYAREALTVAANLPARQAAECSWDDSLRGLALLDDLRHQVGVWWPNEARTG
jgi:predicted dehydrogenase